MRTINTLKISAITIATFIFGTVQNATAQGDNCGVATAITPGTYTGTTVGASVDTQPICGTSDGSGGGVWYSITGNTNCMQYTASLCTNTTFDTKIRVFKGACGSLTCVTGIDDFCGLQSEVSWAYTPGVTYYILVHGFGSSEGPFELNVTESFVDNTAPAPVPLVGTTDQSQLSNTTCMASFSQGDLAQSFIPTQDSMCGAGIEITTASSGDLTLQLWDGLPNAGGDLLAQGTTTYTSATWIDVTWPRVAVNQGSTYYLVATSTTTGDCWAGTTTDSYAGGNVHANTGYDPFPNYDYVFETYYGCGTPTLPTVTDICEVTSIPAPTAYDLCAGTVSGTPDVTFPISTVGTTVVTWTYDDGNGNTSTQTQDVVITGVETGVTQNGSTLTADSLGLTYQWLDCDNGYAVISGETNASFTPTDTVGNYAVEITDNGCVDTSACFMVDMTGIDEFSAVGVSIYPNPTSGQFTVDAKNTNLETLKIVDAEGRLVYELSGVTESKVEVDISGQSPGVYFIQASGDFGSASQRIILE